MAEQTVTQADIANLARKLDEMAEVLTEKERALLLAVFKLASLAINNRLRPGGGSQTEGAGSAVAVGGTALKTGALSDGFKGAFRALGTTDFSIRDNLGKAAGGVGIGVIW